MSSPPLTSMKDHAQANVLDFVEKRPDGTTCPSEIARSLATEAGDAEAWRAYMAMVHRAVDDLHAEGRIGLSWKSKAMSERSGPYRIGKPR